jgi:hypothetical protein
LIEEVTLKNREEFPIPFEVPFKSATRNLNDITLHTKFSEFLKAATQQMETRLSLLASIAYVPSYKPKSPKPVPKLLEDNKDWETLLDDVDKYRVACMTKGAGKGTWKEAGIVKAFVIKIVDMSVSDEKVFKKVSRISSISSTDHFEILRQTQEPKNLHPSQLSQHPILFRLKLTCCARLRSNTCAQLVIGRAMFSPMVTTTHTACKSSQHGHTYSYIYFSF